MKVPAKIIKHLLTEFINCEKGAHTSYFHWTSTIQYLVFLPGRDGPAFTDQSMQGLSQTWTSACNDLLK